VRYAAAFALAACLIAAGCGGSSSAQEEPDATSSTESSPTLEALWRAPGEDVAIVPGTSDFTDCAGRTLDVSELAPPDPGVFPIVEDGTTLVIDVRGATLADATTTNP